ncbi:transcription factor bHLH91 [Manihot esculenta]|uniref:BHLH domain-containing protein n=1 Tax=Manihot esculenta TaxID=3983 RepID=A0A2C9V5X4_MANES|nr:transcription factor bHLH91 [Manihot esculenta]OAY39902.1 hypothetical protein MANES_10G132400v8 [Manihot esculenta]
MYVEIGCSFDPNSMVEGPEDEICQVLQPPPHPPQMAETTTNDLSFEENLKLSTEELQNLKLSKERLSYHHSNFHHQEDDASASMEIHLQNHQQMAFNNTHLMQDSSNQVLTFTSSDLLNLFHLPRSSASSLLPDSSISFTNTTHTTPLGFVEDLPMADTAAASSILYDPLFHLNLPPQPPLFKELFQSLPSHGYSLPASSRGSSLFPGGGDDHVEGSGGGGLYQDGDVEHQFDNGVLDFTWDMACIGKGREAGKMTKHFATERQRRQHLNDKYKALRDLVPNPTKNDRASVVGDAIEYIKELLRTVNELKILVDQKRCARERSKRRKTEDDSTENAGSEICSAMKSLGDHPDHHQSFNNGSLRSSWLQRKSKDTEVDVRIIDDEVTIKLVQRKKINCLLFVSKVVDELKLDLHHVAGGHIGDYYSFLFNTKIYEGSSVYASAIANKLIEVVDRHYYASTPSTSCYIQN